LSQSLAAASAGYALVLAVAAGVCGALGRRPGPGLTAGSIVLGFALALQAVLCLADLAGGERPSETGTAVGYLAASVAILPIAGFLAASEASGWSSAVLALAFLALAAVALRLAAVW
jgi:hypothetical protein